MLGIVTCHFNPCRYDRPRRNYWQFRRSIEAQTDAPLITVELSFDGQFDVADAVQIAGDRQHCLWQKERLLNLAIARLPTNVDNVAWIDADLLFCNPYWADTAEKMLESQAAIQLFETCHFADRAGDLIDPRPSFCYVHQHGRQPKQRFAPGGAWAARRDVLPLGLYDADIIGGGDTSLIEAWGGDQGQYAVYRRRYQSMPASVRRYDAWANQQTVNGRLGYVPGAAVHLWHGDRPQRDYTGRYEILARHQFDADRDVRIGQNGAWEWATDKPELHNAVRKYFFRRREDG